MTTKIDANLLEHLPAETANLICTIMESVDFDGHFSANQYQELLATLNYQILTLKLRYFPSRRHVHIALFQTSMLVQLLKVTQVRFTSALILKSVRCS